MDNQVFGLLGLLKKKVEKNHYSDTQSSDSKENINSFETQLAIVSHYLQNKGTLFETTYKTDAMRVIHYWSNLLT